MTRLEVRFLGKSVYVYDTKKGSISYIFDLKYYDTFELCTNRAFDDYIMKKYIEKHFDPIVLYEIKSFIPFKERVITLYYRLKDVLKEYLDGLYLKVEKGLINLKKEDIFILGDVFSNIDPKKHITISEYIKTHEKYHNVYYYSEIHHEYMRVINIMMDYVSFFVLKE